MAELVHSIRRSACCSRSSCAAPASDAYELVMGERRWRASQEAGLDDDPRDRARDRRRRHAARRAAGEPAPLQLNPLEEAAAYEQLLEDFGCTHEELATRIGRSRPQISNTLRLLKLLACRPAPGGGRRALGRATPARCSPSRTPTLQDRLAQRVVAEGISVRGLEEIVAVGDTGRRRLRASRARKPVAPGLADLADRLSDRFETRVKVDLGKAKGKITVEFASPRRPAAGSSTSWTRATATTGRSESSSADHVAS